MAESIFGTDGIRGIYGKDLTEERAFALGYALGRRGGVLIGRDNRPSSPSLAAATVAGVKAGGGEGRYLGLVTTPALYYILTRTDFRYAVMITASHNPPEHNGLKVFSREGKIGESARLELECDMREAPAQPSSYPEAETDSSPLALYEDFFLKSVGSLKGITLAVDFAGGAGYAFRDLLSRAGAHVIPLHLRERGDRINGFCGALHPSICAAETVKSGADLGISLDGDGDRIIAANRRGEVMDGDAILFLLACRMKKAGSLRKDKVALTVMTNSGVLKSLSDRGIGALSCAVGDSAVCETMREEGLNLGGEQSGHLILGDLLMTGDGLLVGGVIAKSLLEEGDPTPMEIPVRYPQVLLNLPVRDKKVACDPLVQSLAASLKSDWSEGRILVRASGTEEVVRIMTEHPNEEVARRAAEILRAEIEKRET